MDFGKNCSSQTRTCRNGNLSGSFTNANCNVAVAEDCSLGGLNIANGASITAYKSATANFGGNCVSQERTCTDGNLTGTFEFNSCKLLLQTPAHLADHHWNTEPVLLPMQQAMSAGSICRSELRSCENGNLSGSYAFEVARWMGTECCSESVRI